MSNPEPTPTPAPPTQSDWLLEELVTAINLMGRGSIPVTLWVEGATISGELISFKEFFDEFGKSLSAPASEEPGRAIEDRYRKMGQEAFDAMAAQANPSPPTYIHLKNAQTFYGTQPIPSSGGFLWRGLMAEVSAFSLGKLGHGG